MLELITHDSGYDMARTAMLATQAVEVDGVVAMIGYSDSDSVLAAGPILQAAGVPFLTVGATSPRLPAQIGDMMFLTAFGDNVQAAAGAEFAMNNFGDRAYLLWDEGQVYTTLLAGYFKEAFTDGGGAIVAEDTYPSLTTDVSAQIDFMERYEVRFGHPVENAFTALGYDSIKLLADAIGRAGSLDGQAIKAALEATTDISALTGSITLTPESHVP